MLFYSGKPTQKIFHLRIPWRESVTLAHIGERKKLCHSFGKAVDLLLAVCMLFQEMADMLFYLGAPVGAGAIFTISKNVTDRQTNRETHREQRTEISITETTLIPWIAGLSGPIKIAKNL